MNHSSRPTYLILLLLIAVNFAAAILVPPWFDDVARRRVTSSGVLRVGMDPAYPPFENEQDGELVGYDVELARRLADELGLRLELVPTGYDGLYDALVSGQIDVILSSYPYSPELCHKERCTRPYFQAGQMLVARSGSDIAGPQDLADRSVAVELGGPADALARDWEASGKIGARVPLDSPQAALAALSSGQADAAIVDRISALTFTGGESLVVLEPALQDESFVAVIAHSSTWLQRRLDGAMARLEQEGELKALEDKWVK